jgi:polyhydroxybutyrate depolymerase
MATVGILQPGAIVRLALVLVASCACASDRRLPDSTEITRTAASPSGPPSGSPCDTDTGLASGLSEHHLASGSVERRFLVYLPPGADRHAALPVVLNLHGSGGTPEGQLAQSQLTALADSEGFVVVAPASMGERWNVPPDAGKPDDVRFINDTLDAVTRLSCVDARRVFATGFSGGARMSSQLGCDLSDRIAAIAAVGGLRFPAPCKQARSMPILAFHGTGDTVNPYAGGGAVYWGTSVESALEGWASHNGCGPRSERHVAPLIDQLAYGGGGCVDVVLYRIEGFEHAWPGAIYPDREAGTANALIWTFFQDHPLAAAP